MTEVAGRPKNLVRNDRACNLLLGVMMGVSYESVQKAEIASRPEDGS